MEFKISRSWRSMPKVLPQVQQLTSVKTWWCSEVTAVQLQTNTSYLRFTKTTTVSVSTLSFKFPIMVERRARPIYRQMRGTSWNSSRSRRSAALPTGLWLSRDRTHKITRLNLLEAYAIYNKISHQFKEAQDLQQTSEVETFPPGQLLKYHLLPQGSVHLPRPLFRANHQEAPLTE